MGLDLGWRLPPSRRWRFRRFGAFSRRLMRLPRLQVARAPGRLKPPRTRVAVARRAVSRLVPLVQVRPAPLGTWDERTGSDLQRLCNFLRPRRANPTA